MKTPEQLKATIKRRSTSLQTRMVAYLIFVCITYNKTNRNVTTSGNCRYEPISPNGLACAIGELIPHNLQLLYDKRIDNSIYKIIEDQYTFKPKWMLDFDPLFLRRIQAVHDYPDRFDSTKNEKGNYLTEEGKKYVRNIANCFDIPLSKLSEVI